MRDKIIKKIVAGFVIIAVVFGSFFLEQVISVNAATKKEINTQNKKARKAFLTCVKEYKKDHAMDDTKLRYLFIDLDGDKMDELLTYPGYGNPSYIIYNYKNGKVSEVAIISHQDIQYFYKDTGMLFATGVQMGIGFDSYYKLVNDELKCIAQEMVYYYDFENNNFNQPLEKPVCFEYIKNKKVSKTKFNKYVKSLKKGKKINFNKVKWKEL